MMKVKLPVIMALIATNGRSAMRSRDKMQMLKESMTSEDFDLFTRECLFQELQNIPKIKFDHYKGFMADILLILELTKQYAKKFVDKVENGRAKSVETYSDMKVLIDKINRLGIVYDMESKSPQKDC